jgi:hypothetical protein
MWRFARDEKIKKINKNRKGKQEIFIIKFTKIGGFAPPQMPSIGHSGEPQIEFGADAGISICVGLYLSSASDPTVVMTFLGDHQDFAQKPSFKRLFLREAEKSIGHFSPRSLPPGYYFLSMAFRH